MTRARPYLLFAALTLACFWRFLFLGWTLYDVPTLQGHLGTRPAPQASDWFEASRPPVDRGDTILSLPMLNRLYNEGLHHGELRLWNPSLFCGYPLYNNLLVHPFYPPNLVLHAALPPRIAFDLNLMLHFFFSGAAMYWLLRGLGRSEPAATLGGTLWMLLGYNMFWFSTGTFMGASVFAPLALLGLKTGLDRRDLRPVALGALAMGGVILGSHGQHALHLLIFFSLWLLVSWIGRKEDRPLVLKGGLIFLGGALGVGMAAILTQMDSVFNGLRVPGEDALLHYASPWKLPTYIVGVAIGKVHFPGDGLLRSEFTILAGIAGTVLAGIGAVCGRRDPWTRFLSIVAVAALLVAFVKPLADLALCIPFLNLSMPARWVYVFGFCITLLAADGLEALLRDPGRLRKPGLIACAAFVILAGLLGTGAVVETLAGGIFAVAAFVFAAPRPRLGLAFVMTALLIDLLPNFMLFNRHTDPRPLEETAAAATEIRGREKDPWRATGSIRLDGGPADANGWTVSIGNNLLALQGIEAVMGYESIAPLDTCRYAIAISGRRAIMGSGRVLAVINMKSPLLDLANMKYVFMPFIYTPEPRFKPAGTWGPLAVYENTAALPRAYLVSKAIPVADDGEAAAALQSTTFDPRTTAVIEAREVPKLGDGGGSVSWISRGADRFELAVEAKADALLVVSDTYYPGWDAELDGAAVPILKTNLAFRGVAVPAGAHKVSMRFRPPSARNGLVLSGLSIAALLAYCGRRKKSPSPQGGGILPI